MGKKRKGSGSQPGNELIKSEQTRYSINEKFADSEDEFFAGRDQILLDGPANKRRKVHKDGRESRSFRSGAMELNCPR